MSENIEANGRDENKSNEVDDVDIVTESLGFGRWTYLMMSSYICCKYLVKNISLNF